MEVSRRGFFRGCAAFGLGAQLNPAVKSVAGKISQSPTATPMFACFEKCRNGHWWGFDTIFGKWRRAVGEGWSLLGKNGYLVYGSRDMNQRLPLSIRDPDPFQERMELHASSYQYQVPVRRLKLGVKINDTHTRPVNSILEVRI
jgi:hypothetical protein